MIRGIRGATTADENTPESILAATRELLEALIAANGLQPDDVASAIFTTTPDLNAEYPAKAARALDWRNVAMLCAHEMDVPHGLKKCIRILIHWNTPMRAGEVRHVYLRGAVVLRPDRVMPDSTGGMP
jgi:chorismate mutase